MQNQVVTDTTWKSRANCLRLKKKIKAHCFYFYISFNYVNQRQVR